MKNGERQDIVLSEICCQYLKDIQDVSYALAYTLLYLRDYKALQRRFRSISPKVQEEGDWVRIRFEGMAVAFSIRDEAIEFYRQAIYEFQCFGSAVRIISIYENYVRRIVEIASQRIPDEINTFKNNHNKLIRTNSSFWSDKLGRGIDFFREVFGWNPLPSYRPGLQLMFHLRNVTVHNNGVVDDKLCQLVKNPHIECIGKLKVGDKVPWNLGTVLQLQHLVINVLTDSDKNIVSKLNLPTLKRQPFWRVDTLNTK